MTGYEPFSAEINKLFGSDVSSHDVKALFRKIAANPEAEVDWSEVISAFRRSCHKLSDIHYIRLHCLTLIDVI